MRWFIRYGAPRNRFQALWCWLCGFDVYRGEAPPWATETTAERAKEPEAKPLPPLGKPKTGVGQWRPRERPRV